MKNIVFWLAVTLQMPTASGADLAAYEQKVQPILAAKCFQCHGEKKQEAGIDFAGIKNLPVAMKQYRVWRNVVEQVEAGAMPPDGEPPLTAEQKTELIGWIQRTFDTTKTNDPGPPLVRQLTRVEYNNTMRDLFFGIQFDAARAGGIPHEDVFEGYANQAGAQTFGETLLSKYFDAAERTLQFFFETDKNRLQAAHKALFVVRPGNGVSDHDAATKILERFAKRAYRRPVETDEIDRIVRVADLALKGGDSFEVAIRKALKPILVSPYFLHRIERQNEATDTGVVYRITDHELAVRLSYFLWATMPDEALFAVADSGQLSQPEGLESQVRRMLVDPKSTALTEYFAFQWLRMNQFRRALPSRNHFPNFTPSLKNAMEWETRKFFDQLRLEDRSILELLDSDYTYANEELAKHYGLVEVKGSQIQRVALRPEDHRGGLLGMGTMLAQTSHTDRTKPTARGKWILDVVLGTPPPPPPANVSNFKPQPKDKPEPKNFREKLNLHATNATCANCHAKIDPLGFALENFDAVGMWREQVGGIPVDNTGRLPAGKEFRGVDGLREILRGKQAQFQKNLAEQLLTYALGRTVDYYDEQTLKNIVASLEKNEHKFSTLVLEVVKSFPFQYRKNGTDE